jgi:hypothetical protein
MIKTLYVKVNLLSCSPTIVFLPSCDRYFHQFDASLPFFFNLIILRSSYNYVRRSDNYPETVIGIDIIINFEQVLDRDYFQLDAIEFEKLKSFVFCFENVPNA